MAKLYGVETRIINRAVKRNIERFPTDFAFQLSDIEEEALRSQIGISNIGRGGKRYRSLAFTEHGIAMLSGVLRSDIAIQVNISIMRTFVQLRRILESNNELVKKLEQIERKLLRHDHDLKSVFEAIRQLMATNSPSIQRLR